MAKPNNMKVENWELDRLIPYARNPKQPHTEAQIDKLAAGLKEFGWRAPILALSDGEIVDGHLRVKAARKLGMKQVPVVLADDMTPAQVKAFRLYVKNSAGWAEWDFDLAALEIEELKLAEYDLDLTGFEPGELAEFVAGEPGTGGSGGEPPGPQMGRAEELLKKWGVERGQIWEIGRHRVMCGDCTMDAGALMGDARYTLLGSDPPYGVSYASKNEFLNAIDKGNHVQAPIEGDHQTPEAMREFWTVAFTAVRPFAKPGASYYITGPQGGDLLLPLLLALKESGFPLRHMLIWAKNNHVLGRADYNYKHEPIIYGWVEGAGHKFYGNGSETSLWEIPKPQKSDLHPTMKPVELFARAIRNSSAEGDVVADFFLGSGPMIVAAEQLNRICYGMEIEPKYVAVTLERMADVGLEPKLVEKAA